MREILFRGKDESGILNHQWQFGALDNTDEKFPKIIRLDRWGNKMIVNVVPETVGQFTGHLGVQRGASRAAKGQRARGENA